MVVKCLPALAGLASLDLKPWSYDIKALDRPFHSAALPGLVRLTLCKTPGSGIDLARALATSPLGAQLENLDLTHGNWDDEAVAALLQVGLPRLVTLDLSDNGLRERTAHALPEAPLPHLRNLRLDRTYLRDSVLALARSPLLPRLRLLGLVACWGVTPEAMVRVVEAAAAVPGLRLVLSRDDTALADARRLLGERLILE
jgi:hypothetical protein